jgi:hypothetical protein
MTAKLKIETDAEGLRIRSVYGGSPGLAVLAGVLGGALVYWVGRVYFHRPALMVITAVAALWISSRWWRSVRAELRVTPTELQVIGDARVAFRFDRRIPLADIRRLEYRAQVRDGIGLPSGLYAVQKWRSDCVLPNLDEAQTQRAMEAIHLRFPAIPILPALEERVSSPEMKRLEPLPGKGHSAAER